MSVITYTALRSIERNSFESLAKIDVAVAVNGYTSVAGDFLGLLSGEWVNVEGFTIQTNNGWHQLSADSTAGQILVTDTLIAEVAGNSISIKGYVRGSGQIYSFDLGFGVIDRSRKVKKDVKTALFGNVESLTHTRQNYYSLTTTPRPIEGSYKQLIEYLDSCESDEMFTIDFKGSLSLPVKDEQARITTIGYSESRLSNTHQQISYEIVLL